MVNADHAQGGTLREARDGNCGLIECGGNVVQRDGVERVGAAKVSEWSLMGSSRVTYVSALTSQMTDSLRSGVERDSTLTKASSVCQS